MAVNITTYFTTVRDALNSKGNLGDIFDDLQQFKTNAEMYKYIQEIPEVKSKVCFQQENLKDQSNCLMYKELGNAAYKGREISKAIQLYTKSIAYAVDTSDEPMSCYGYANRSAALFHIGEYAAAMRDIDRALAAHYPSSQQPKLLDRKNKCLKLSAVKSESDNIDKLQNLEIASEEETSHIPELDFGASLDSPSASSAIGLKYSSDMGNHFVANRDIAVGSVLMVERPYSSILLPSSWDTHCYHCCSRLPPDVVPCDTCTEVMFCDASCMKEAKIYHQYECRRILTLRTDPDWLPLLTYRVVAVTGMSVLSEAVNSENYAIIYDLLGHFSKRKLSDLFTRGVKAFYLVQMLKSCGFFPSSEECLIHEMKGDASCEECEVMVGEEVFQHFQSLPCNSHGLYERLDHTEQIQESTMEKIGTAVYPTLSLINHSCDPNVTRFCYKDTGVILAIRPIKEGEQIVDSYYNYTDHNKKERQQHLLEQYYFNCNCVPCSSDWPKYSELTDELRWMCTKCGSSIQPDSTTCNCGLDINIETMLTIKTKSWEKCLAVLKKLASRDTRDVLPVLYSHLNLLDKMIEKPHREYYYVQYAIKLCYSLRGNYHSTLHKVK